MMFILETVLCPYYKLKISYLTRELNSAIQLFCLQLREYKIVHDQFI